MIDPLGRATAHERDERGDVVKIIDPAGGANALHRDERGNVPTGATTSTTYDARGLITSIT